MLISPAAGVTGVAAVVEDAASRRRRSQRCQDWSRAARLAGVASALAGAHVGVAGAFVDDGVEALAGGARELRAHLFRSVDGRCAALGGRIKGGVA
jgi:hypothetical protein